LNYSKIKILQEQNKVSNRKIAKVISMSDVGYGKMLEKKSCDVATLEAIARFFKVPVAYFFDENEKPLDTSEPCLDCKQKQKEIDELKEENIEIKNKYIECLEQLNKRLEGGHVANSA
jgi:transcriptional regulator with XRE-family HTH domain